MDQYPKIGRKLELEDPSRADFLVAEYWPTAVRKDNYYWVATDTDDPFVVAYVYEQKGRWYLRRAVTLNTIVFPD